MAATTKANASLIRCGILFKILFLRPQGSSEDLVLRACIQFVAFEAESQLPARNVCATSILLIVQKSIRL